MTWCMQWFWPLSWLKRVCVSDIASSVHTKCSQTTMTPYRHTLGATHLFFRARLRWTCFSLTCCVWLSCCFSRSSAPFERRRGCMCKDVASEMLNVFYRRGTHISGQNRHVLWFSASFYGGGGQCLRVIFSAVRMCSMLQFQGWY